MSVLIDTDKCEAQSPVKRSSECRLQFLWEHAMGHSKAEKSKTHERIVALGSKRSRKRGLAGIGIADLMKEAGLTVGGFCKHFDSRDELVASSDGGAGTSRFKWKAAMNSSIDGLTILFTVSPVVSGPGVIKAYRS